METIAANTVLLVKLIGKSIHEGVVGHCLVESSIKDTHLRDIGQQSLHSIHALDIGGVMQGSQVVAGSKSLHHLGGKQHRLVETLASVHHAVAYGTQFIEVGEHSILALCEHLEDKLHAGSVLLDGTHDAMLLTIELHVDERIRQTYLLDTAAGDDRVVCHVVKCILNRTASAVEYQNLHYYVSDK